jgi:hypothetical protein
MIRKLTFIPLFFFLAPILFGDDIGTTISEDDYFRVYYVQEGIDYLLYLEGKTPLILSLEVNFHGDNMSTDTESPLVSVLSGKEVLKIVCFSPIDTNRAYNFYTDKYYYTFGSVNAVHDDTYIYDLPYPAGKSYVVQQGYGGVFSHFGEFQYSLDFGIPEGEPFYACRSGYVAKVVEEYSGSGTDESFKQRTNHLIIIHNDGTWAQYSHSPQNGIAVETGDYVGKGRLLGYVGNSGYSTSPHLHFSVHKPLSVRGGSVTVPTLFRTAEGTGITLEERKYYRSVTGIH